MKIRKPPVKYVTLEDAREERELIVSRIQALERRDFDTLFLLRTDEASDHLANFVLDHAPVAPPATSALSAWLHTVTLVILFVCVALEAVSFRDYSVRLAGLDAKMKARETVGVPIVEGGTAPSFVVTRTTDIVLDLDQPCWLRVTDGDGKVLSAGFVPAGRSEAAPGAKMPLTIRDGCPGHVAFTVDGQPVDPPREPGHAQNRVEVVTLGVPSVKPQSYIYAVPEERKPCSGRCA